MSRHSYSWSRKAVSTRQCSQSVPRLRQGPTNQHSILAATTTSLAPVYWEYVYIGTEHLCIDKGKREASSWHYPSIQIMSRVFKIRSNGLCKKANALLRLEGCRVAVVIPQPGTSTGEKRGYASHGRDEWPEIHALFDALGVHPFGPDDLDTVADRLGRSSPSTDSTILPSYESSQHEQTEADRFMSDMLASVLSDTPQEAGPMAPSMLPVERHIDGDPCISQCFAKTAVVPTVEAGPGRTKSTKRKKGSTNGDLRPSKRRHDRVARNVSTRSQDMGIQF